MCKLKQWMFALYLCFRYKLIWNPFCGLAFGSYDTIKGEITVNPFNQHFMDVFLHEVGHHLHHKLVNYDDYFKYGTDVRYLDAEYVASKFAIRCGADRKFLLSKFNTYTSSVMRARDWMDRNIFESYLNLVVRCSRYFRNGIVERSNRVPPFRKSKYLK